MQAGYPVVAAINTSATASGAIRKPILAERDGSQCQSDTNLSHGDTHRLRSLMAILIVFVRIADILE